MKNKDRAELYRSMQSAMHCSLQLSRSSFDHSTIKGDSSEADWIGWLKEYLPKRYSVDRAQVIDSDNHVSDQLDLVIYDQQYSHPVFSHNGSKYVTAESVYAVFEVKQALNSTYMEYTGEKIKSVRELKRTSTSIISANGQAHPKKPQPIISGILTLDSEWKAPIAKTVVDNLIKRPKIEQIDLICCLNYGSFSITYNDRLPSDVAYVDQDEALIFFFLELLRRLQLMGTVPAIDISEYAKVLSPNKYKL